jgi:F420-0:gamma-glutamyl ligase
VIYELGASLGNVVGDATGETLGSGVMGIGVGSVEVEEVEADVGVSEVYELG